MLSTLHVLKPSSEYIHLKCFLCPLYIPDVHSTYLMYIVYPHRCTFLVMHECMCMHARTHTHTQYTQWSFGVVLWEIMTLGRLPYEETPAEDMLAVLTGGHRLSQPKNCPDDLWVCPVSLSCMCTHTHTHKHKQVCVDGLVLGPHTHRQTTIQPSHSKIEGIQRKNQCIYLVQYLNHDNQISSHNQSHTPFLHLTTYLSLSSLCVLKLTITVSILFVLIFCCCRIIYIFVDMNNSWLMPWVKVSPCHSHAQWTHTCVAYIPAISCYHLFIPILAYYS